MTIVFLISVFALFVLVLTVYIIVLKIEMDRIKNKKAHTKDKSLDDYLSFIKNNKQIQYQSKNDFND